MASYALRPRILVTGGAGFIGSHLCERLLAAGSDPVEFTMIELAELALKPTGSRSKLVRRPLPQDDPKQQQPDITRAKALLDWRPTVPLAQGLERTIACFRELVRV